MTVYYFYEIIGNTKKYAGFTKQKALVMKLSDMRMLLRDFKNGKFNERRHKYAIEIMQDGENQTINLLENRKLDCNDHIILNEWLQTKQQEGYIVDLYEKKKANRSEYQKNYYAQHSEKMKFQTYESKMRLRQAKEMSENVSPSIL